MATPFTSIKHPIAVDLGRGRIAEEENYAEHIEQMMFQVLFTAPGERINRPDFGCGVKRLVFAPNSEVSAAIAQVTIFQALTRVAGNGNHGQRREGAGDRGTTRDQDRVHAQDQRRTSLSQSGSDAVIMAAIDRIENLRGRDDIVGIDFVFVSEDQKTLFRLLSSQCDS